MRYRTLISSIAGAGFMAAVLVGCTGTPDPTYGTGGIAVLSQRGAAQIKLLSNGKLMVASWNSMRPIEGTNLVRLNANGAADPTYGTDGKATVAPATTALAPDGRAYFISGSPLKLTALTAAGQPDTSFGSVTLPFSLPDSTELTGFLVAPDGNIYISRCNDVGVACQVLRYLPGGQRDSGFAYGGSASFAGVQTVSAGGNAYVSTRPSLQGGPESLQKLTPSGALDTTFGQHGTLTLPTNVRLGSVVVDEANRVTMTVNESPAGSTLFSPFVVRYTSTGAADLTFGFNGIAGMPGAQGGAGALTIDGLGRTVATSSTGGYPGPVQIYRYTTTGAPDTTFGIHGMDIIAGATNYVVTDSANRILLGTAVPPIWHDTDGTTAVFRLTG